MSEWLLAATGIAYLVTAVDLYLRGQAGLALAFVGYFVGNVGLIIAVSATK